MLTSLRLRNRTHSCPTPSHLTLSPGGNWKLKGLDLKSFQAEHFRLESCYEYYSLVFLANIIRINCWQLSVLLGLHLANTVWERDSSWVEGLLANQMVKRCFSGRGGKRFQKGAWTKIVREEGIMSLKRLKKIVGNFLRVWVQKIRNMYFLRVLLMKILLPSKKNYPI